ncbi:hypothetical protein GJAV_G00104810 [Gymnothorax javanicus]|nr:hypothetical protein GJAV_G00104810 [Gymnothorax javanicus]
MSGVVSFVFVVAFLGHPKIYADDSVKLKSEVENKVVYIALSLLRVWRPSRVHPQIMAKSHSSCSETGREAVSKWSDVFDSSKQIAAKPRETYLLNTVRDDLSEDGLIRRWRFGRKDPETRNRTIILVGETGTGKSTLINMMLNYMLGVKWENKVRFQIISDEGERSKTESQTTAVTAYEIHGLESLSVPFSLTVIDTPGFGGTDSPEKDKITVQNLYKLLKSFSGFDQIDAVCLVVKASQNRQSPSQKYIFDTILSLFGKNLEKNIVTLITFSDWLPPSGGLEALMKSGVSLAKDKNNEPVHFQFNNHPLQKPDEIYEEMYKRDWDNGMENMSKFLQALKKMETQNMRMTKKVVKEHQSLEVYIQSLERLLMDVQKTHEALEEAQKTLEELKEDLKQKNKFEYECNKAVMKRIGLEKPVTVCTKCEKECSIVSEWHTLGMQWGTKHFKCPNNCSDYIERKEIYVLVNEKRIEMNEDEKNATEDKRVAVQGMISNLQQDLESREAEKTKLITSCFQSIDHLRELALKFLSDSTHQDILKLIEILEKNNDTEKVEKLRKLLDETA